MTAMSASFVCAFIMTLALPVEIHKISFSSDCACSSSSDVSVTHTSTHCQPPTRCVEYVYTPIGSDTPGRCYVPTKCDEATGNACGHKSYNITIEMSGCSDCKRPTAA